MTKHHPRAHATHLARQGDRRLRLHCEIGNGRGALPQRSFLRPCALQPQRSEAHRAARCGRAGIGGLGFPGTGYCPPPAPPFPEGRAPWLGHSRAMPGSPHLKQSPRSLRSRLSSADMA